MKRWKKMLKKALVLSAFVVVGGLLGSSLEREYQKKLTLAEETVNTIAIVNMDEGVVDGEQQINYASKLMQMPAENYIITGLNDAKNGIKNGTYAAYIVIPENFSEAIVSIQNSPQKIILEYNFNQNLDDEIEKQAIQDVNLFETTLNTNIAYMYVDAILKVFHDVQDDSATILKNDSDELVKLQGVNSEHLITEVGHTEISIIANDIEKVDVTSYLTQNENVLNAMEQEYNTCVQKGVNEFTNIQEGEEEVSVAVNAFFSQYQTILDENETNNLTILETGGESLEKAIGVFNHDLTADINVMELKINELIEAQYISDVNVANEQMKDALLYERRMNEGIVNSLQDTWSITYHKWNDYVQRVSEQNGQEIYQLYQKQVDEELQILVKNAYMQGAKDSVLTIEEAISTEENEELSSINTYTSEEIQNLCQSIENSLEDNASQYIEGATEDIRIVLQEEQIDNLIVNLENAVDSEGNSIIKPTITQTANQQETTIVLERVEMTSAENIKQVVTEFASLFEMQDSRDMVYGVIQTELIDKLAETQREQFDSLVTKENELKNIMTDYEAELSNYNPFKYLQEARMSRYLRKISSNASDMLKVIENNNINYAEYADEVYVSARDDLNMIQDIYQEANKQTISNVKECISTLQNSRTNINGQNTQMLQGFVGLLRYTREGMQDDVEAYGHIVDPVVLLESGEELIGTNKGEHKDGISETQIFMVIVGLGIIIVFAGVALYIQNRTQILQELEETN